MAELSIDAPDFALDAVQAQVASGVTKLAQGIVSGPWALAFSFDWARQIVESFELSAVPKAPSWLMGATNVDGNILPVIDLAQYFSPEIAVPSAHHQRLLIGGINAIGSDDAVALVFSGLPQQLRYVSQQLTYASALPPKLSEMCDGVAQDASGRNFLEINVDRLIAILSDELSLL
jgi:chemotaxis signal transduction protein